MTTGIAAQCRAPDGGVQHPAKLRSCLSAKIPPVQIPKKIRAVATYPARLLSWAEGALKWFLVVLIGSLTAAVTVWLAIRSFNSAPTADAVFALGVVTGTTAAAFDAWSRLEKRKGRRAARGLAWWATALTWVGLMIACYSATSTEFEPLPGRLAIEFFVLMTMASAVGGWCFAQLANRAPCRPSSRPRILG